MLDAVRHDDLHLEVVDLAGDPKAAAGLIVLGMREP
jgi:hypothetical protein